MDFEQDVPNGYLSPPGIMSDTALELFNLSDWIVGAETGGIEPPRKVTGLRTVNDGALILVQIEYMVQDGEFYHDLDAGKTGIVTYQFGKNTISCSEELFPFDLSAICSEIDEKRNYGKWFRPFGKYWIEEKDS